MRLLQKTAVHGLLFVLLVPGTQAFAQFKNPALIEKNLANIDIIIERATKGATLGRPVITELPPDIVNGKAVGLLRVKLPKQVTPVSESYTRFLDAAYKAVSPSYAYPTRESMVNIAGASWVGKNGERAFYTDQNQLARDLDNYYKETTQVRIGPDGREVKLFMLPVDGIVYKPVGYRDPLVLNSKDYFVIYDVASQTGKIADNKPEVYNLFRLPRTVYDEIWEGMEAPKVFDDLGTLCDRILAAHFHKVRLDQLRVRPNKTIDNPILVRLANHLINQRVNNPSAVLAYLQDNVQLRQLSSNNELYVVDIPVDGLTLIKSDGTREVFDRQNYAMVFWKAGAVGILPRATLQNPKLFKVVEKE